MNCTFDLSVRVSPTLAARTEAEVALRRPGVATGRRGNQAAPTDIGRAEGSSVDGESPDIPPTRTPLKTAIFAGGTKHPSKC